MSGKGVLSRSGPAPGQVSSHSVAEPNPPVMTIAEVAEPLPKVPRASAYKLAQQGRIPRQKAGRHWRFHRKALDDLLSSARSHESLGDLTCARLLLRADRGSL